VTDAVPAAVRAPDWIALLPWSSLIARPPRGGLAGRRCGGRGFTLPHCCCAGIPDIAVPLFCCCAFATRRCVLATAAHSPLQAPRGLPPPPLAAATWHTAAASYVCESRVSGNTARRLQLLVGGAGACRDGRPVLRAPPGAGLARDALAGGLRAGAAGSRPHIVPR